MVLVVKMTEILAWIFALGSKESITNDLLLSMVKNSLKVKFFDKK